MRKWPDRNHNGWAIVHSRGVMHTNWMLGRGNEAWPDMLPVVLFQTRAGARTALAKLRNETSLPFTPYIVRVKVEAGPSPRAAEGAHST